MKLSDLLPPERVMEIAKEARSTGMTGTGFSDCEYAIQAAAHDIARAALEFAANRLEKRAEERFNEHGTREYGTGAAYYAGSNKDWHEAQDEEDENG